MSNSRAVAVVPQPRNKSRVTNGALFVTSDGRSAWARRFADLVAEYTSHVGGVTTPPTRALIRRIASLDIESERIEGELAEGRTASLDLYNRISGNQRRLLEELGFDGTKRDSVPSVEDLIAGRAS